MLAVAGLIMLIVFAALPALDRNSRNSKRDQDAANILQATSHYMLNNSGDFPTTSAFLSGQQLYYYNASNISFNTTGTGFTPGQNPETDTESIVISDYAKCKTDNSGTIDSGGADYSNVVALYAVESGNGYISKCEQL